MAGEAAVGAGVGSGVGAIVGGLLNQPEDYYAGIQIPAIEDLIKAGKLDSTAFNDISLDPATRAAQMQALAELSNEGNRGGASIQSKAAQTNLMDAAATNERMNREAILNNMASRGQAGGGAELAARLVANQNNARNTALSSAQLAGDDRARALQAMSSAGSLGGNIRSQDYGIAANKANAQDSLARWNAQNRRSAYGDSIGWQLARAGGQQANANAQYNRGTSMGSAIGGLAGGVYDYAANAKGSGGGANPYNVGSGADYSPGGAYEGYT